MKSYVAKGLLPNFPVSLVVGLECVLVCYPHHIVRAQVQRPPSAPFIYPRICTFRGTALRQFTMPINQTGANSRVYVGTYNDIGGNQYNLVITLTLFGDENDGK